MQSLIVKLVVCLLKKNLSLQNKSVLIKAIYSQLDILPLHEIIKMSENGSLEIKGKELDYEEQGLLKDSAKALRDNRVYSLIQDQVLFEAMTLGINAANFEQMYFSKACVWWGRRENELTKLIAGETEPS